MMLSGVRTVLDKSSVMPSIYCLNPWCMNSSPSAKLQQKEGSDEGPPAEGSDEESGRVPLCDA